MPAGTDPDAAMIPIAQDLADEMDQAFGSGRKTQLAGAPPETAASA